MCVKGPENCCTQAQRLFVNLEVALFEASASAAWSKAQQVTLNKLNLSVLSPHLLHKKMGSRYCAISCRSCGSDMTSRCVSIIARVRRWRRVGFVPGRIFFLQKLLSQSWQEVNGWRKHAGMIDGLPAPLVPTPGRASSPTLRLCVWAECECQLPGTPGTGSWHRFTRGTLAALRGATQTSGHDATTRN